MRPVDLNNLVPNSQLASKVQHVENNRQAYFVHDQTREQNKKFLRELKKVNTTDKAYEVKINNKQKGNKGNSFKERENKSSKDIEEKSVDRNEKAALSETIGTKIDIKI